MPRLLLSSAVVFTPCFLPVLLAAIRQTQRGEDESDDEEAGRRRRRVRADALPPSHAYGACSHMHEVWLAQMLPCLLPRFCSGRMPHTTRTTPPHARMQRALSPVGDPLEAARGGLRRGRSAAAIKQ